MQKKRNKKNHEEPERKNHERKGKARRTKLKKVIPSTLSGVSVSMMLALPCS